MPVLSISPTVGAVSSREQGGKNEEGLNVPSSFPLEHWFSLIPFIFLPPHQASQENHKFLFSKRNKIQNQGNSQKILHTRSYILKNFTGKLYIVPYKVWQQNWCLSVKHRWWHQAAILFKEGAAQSGLCGIKPATLVLVATSNQQS